MPCVSPPRPATVIIRSALASLSALMLIAEQSHAQVPGRPAAGVDVPGWVAGVRDGSGPQLARAQRSFATAGASVPQSTVADLTALLRAPQPPVRAHAAAALGSLGVVARSALPALATAMTDSAPAVRAEAAWALGVVSRGSSAIPPALADALADALVDPSRLVVLRAREAIRPLAVRATLLPRIDALLADTAEGKQSAGLFLLHRLEDRPLAAARFAALLYSPEPSLRAEAAWGIADVAPLAVAVLPRLDSLRNDASADVREAAEYAAKRIRRPAEASPAPPAPLAGAPACGHRAVEGLIPMTFVVLPGSTSLHDDGKGSYQQAAGTRSSQNYSYNLLLPYADGTIPPYRRVSTIGSAREPVRTLALDLSEPVLASGARALGVVRDSAVRLHVFHMLDAQRVIWNLRDIPVGADVESDRTEFHVNVAGVPHVLQFGPWALGQCNEPYAKGGVLRGEGTTPVRVRRLSEGEFVIEAPPGSVGRLWDARDQSRPADRGLYRFAFRARIAQQPR